MGLFLSALSSCIESCALKATLVLWNQPESFKEIFGIPTAKFNSVE